MNNKFKEEDKQKIVEFLNMVAQHARFSMNTNELISYFKLLAFMQQTVIPKINANILEVVQIHEPSEEVEQPKKTKSK